MISKKYMALAFLLLFASSGCDNESSSQTGPSGSEDITPGGNDTDIDVDKEDGDKDDNSVPPGDKIDIDDPGEKDPSKDPEKFCENSSCSDDNTLNKCQDGVIAVETCTFGCVNAACAPAPDAGTECTETLCSEDGIVLNICENGYIKTEECQYGCKNGACSEAQCTENKCEDNVLLQCSDGVVTKIDCPSGCLNGVCQEENGCKENTCSGDTLIICNDGETSTEVCQYGCSNGACKPAECTETVCKDENTRGRDGLKAIW